MTTQQFTVKCGYCKVPIKGPDDAKDDDVFSCPSCGNSDTLENIRAEAFDCMKQQAADDLNKAVRDIFRNTKGVTYTPSPTVKKARRFIAEADM